MESSRITPAIIIWQNTLKEVPLNELTQNLTVIEGSLATYHEKIKKAVGYRLGNIHQFFQTQLMGNYFSFSVYHMAQLNPRKNFHWQVTVWDMTGNNTVFYTTFPSETIETDKMPETVWKDLISHCEDFIRGKQDCSECKKQISKNEIAGSYFSGRYCSNCWETKWKKIEAAETYD